MPNRIPKGITREHILAAILDLKMGVSHGFGESTSYDLLYEGRHYPPKAVVGLAAGKLLGSPLGPYDFKGGLEMICFKTLRTNGFQIVTKTHFITSSESQPESKGRNPSWSRDELILALHLYFTHPPLTINKDHRAVIELSSILNALGTKLRRIENGKFRNENGVYMKLCNFLRLDSSYGGAGLKGGGKLEEEVWNLYAENRSELERIAASIVAAITDDDTLFPDDLEDPDATEFPEGALLYRAHLRRERNRQLVAKAKAAAKRRSPDLSCEICSFSFVQRYGELGEDFIECHHTIPVSSMKPGDKTRLKDVALLCSNCHRMVHRRKKWLSIVELRTILAR